MVKVLHVALTNNVGGIEVFLRNMYINIDRNKIHFDFVTSDVNVAFEDELHSFGAHIYHLTKPYKLVNYVHEIYSILRDNKYDVLHIHKNSAVNLIPLFVGRLADVPTIIVHSHNTNPKNNNRIVRFVSKINTKWILPLFNIKKIACSDSAAFWLFGKCNKYDIIHNAIDLSRYRVSENKRKLIRDELGVDGRIVYGHVGGFIEQKNHIFLLRVFKEILSKQPSSILILIGDGGLRQSIIKEIDELGIKNNVFILGMVEDTARYYQAMDVFIFPSLYEGLGIALIEAQSLGIPCFVSDKCPYEAIVTSQVYQLSLDLTPEKWAKKILDTNLARIDEQYKVSSAGYDIKKEVKKLERIYLECTKHYI